MTIESAYVPAPYNGISQSAPQVRLDEQAEDLYDCIVDLPDGWRKRPPFTYSATLLEEDVTSTAKVIKVRDPDDGTIMFLVLNREGTDTVARLYTTADWSLVTVDIETAAQTYLDNATSPKTQLRGVSAVDYTLICDRTREVEVDATPVAARDPEALIFIKSGAFGKTYKITVTVDGGTPRVGYVTTPSGDDAADSIWVDTDRIAQGIAGSGYSYAGTNQSAVDNIETELLADGFTITILGGVIHLTHEDDFTVTFEDSQGHTAMSVAKGTVNNFSDLPKISPVDGFTVKVLPQRGDAEGAYWVKFEADPSPGIWKETVAPGSEKGIDPETMPIGLYKDALGDWHLDVMDWKQRTVGDEDLAPDPLFVGNTIQDIGYVFNRLCLVSNEEVFLCSADDPFRIYPATLTTTIDSDPIAFLPPTGDARFFALTTFEKAAFITGIQQQCILRNTSDGPITVTTGKLSNYSAFELYQDTSGALRPIGNNNKVYLPVPLGDPYIGFREMKIDRVSGEDIGDDLTAALPRLLRKTIDCAATNEEAFTALYGISGARTLYYHIFRYAENQRVQNGFFPWFLPEGWTLVDISVYATDYFIFALQTSTGAFSVFQVKTQPGLVGSPGSSYDIKLDMRQTQDQVASATYNAATDQTTITGVLEIPAGVGYVVAALSDGEANYPEGYLAEVVSQPSATSIIVKGDWTQAVQNFFLGVSYTGYWKPTRFFKVSRNGDNRVLHSGDLTLKRLVLDLVRAGTMTVRVSVGSRSVRTYNLAVTGYSTPTPYTGEMTVPLKGNSKNTVIEIMDAGHIGATITGFEWFGDFVSRSQRTT